MDLVISIVNYNTRELLNQCLHSIHSASIQADYRVYVADNNSTDGSQEMIASSFPSVRLVRNIKNIGFSSANNQIIRNTDSKYVLVLNPDIIVQPQAVESLIGFMDMHSNVGVAGCKLLNPDNSLQFSCRRFPVASTIFLRGLRADRLFTDSQYLRHYMMSDWDHSAAADVDWVTGACMLLRRDALNETGLFDEGFFIYFEDVDLCIRMWKNWKVCYYPYSFMIHHHQQVSRRPTAIRLKLTHMISAYRFFKKHGMCPKRAVTPQNL